MGAIWRYCHTLLDLWHHLRHGQTLQYIDIKTKINDARQLGSLIQSRRKQLGITQKDLAAYCGLSHNGISRIELGESDVRLSSLLRLAEMLGVRIDFHLEDE